MSAGLPFIYAQTIVDLLIRGFVLYIIAIFTVRICMMRFLSKKITSHQRLILLISLITSLSISTFFIFDNNAAYYGGKIQWYLLYSLFLFILIVIILELGEKIIHSSKRTKLYLLIIFFIIILFIPKKNDFNYTTAKDYCYCKCSCFGKPFYEQGMNNDAGYAFCFGLTNSYKPINNNPYRSNVDVARSCSCPILYSFPALTIYR